MEKRLVFGGIPVQYQDQLREIASEISELNKFDLDVVEKKTVTGREVRSFC